MADRASALLIVEDERNLGLTLSERFKKEGFETSWATSVEAARAELAARRFDLALLDVGLPDGTGFQVATHIKKFSPGTAIVFLTAHGTPEDRVHGLELGAEDYVVKPFHLKELILRVQNALKRARYLSSPSHDTSGPVQIGRARVDFAKFEASVGEEVQPLTHKECALLRLLVDRRGKVVSRDEILDQVWSKDEFPSPRTVDNFIMRLRRLVEQNPESPQIIKSIRGVGYQLS